MGTMKAVLQAKERTKELLKDMPGVDGIGISWDENGEPCVRVNVDVEADASRLAIPTSVDGVRVRVEIVRQAQFE